MSNRGTPGAESNINQNLESHIPNRPFQFSSVPQGRGSGLVNGNNSTIAPSNKSYHSASSNLHRQAVAGSSSSAGGGLGTPSSEVSPANNTMKNEKDSNPSPGTPVLGTPGLPPNSTSATSTSASTTANGGTAKGRAGGGASDFVKKLYR